MLHEKTRIYREKAASFIKAMGKGYSIEQENRDERRGQLAAWEAYFRATLGRIPVEVTNFQSRVTKAITLPSEFPEDFDPLYPGQRPDERSPLQRRIEAARLCKCQLGEAADREGWLRSMIEFAERFSRLPVGAEIDGVKAISAKAEGALAAARGAPFYAELANLRKLMIESAHREVFGRG